MDNWNDDRLDELSTRVDEGFKEMREGFARMDQRFERMDHRFARAEERFATKEEMNKGFAEVKGEIRGLGERFDRLLNTLALISWGVAGTLLAALISVLVAVLL